MQISNKLARGCALALSLCFVVALATVLGGRSQAKEKANHKQAVDAQGAPMFRVDPFWPKPLPNRWSMQQVTGSLRGREE